LTVAGSSNGPRRYRVLSYLIQRRVRLQPRERMESDDPAYIPKYHIVGCEVVAPMLWGARGSRWPPGDPIHAHVADDVDVDISTP
jgi:hypothetical protein